MALTQEQFRETHHVMGFARHVIGGDCEAVIRRGISFHPQIEVALCAIPVLFNPRLKSSAGRFAPRTCEIELHPGLGYAKPEELRETFLHELAHAMQHLAYKEVNHLASWWEMMHQLGQKPKRTHSIGMCSGPLSAARAGLNAEDLGL